MPLIDHTSLDDFIAGSDAAGAPGTDAFYQYWRDFEYKSDVAVDITLDPFSDAYFDQQIALYEEIAGRALDQQSNEFTQFDMDSHVASASPYGQHNPTALALHHLRLATAINRSGFKWGDRILDFGAGWGLSSEFFARLGLRVTAVDINPNFVQLINTRRERHGLDIEAHLGSFDTYEPDEALQGLFFYECLHHCTKPWVLIQRAAGWLEPGGKIVFAGEPVNTVWWPHWGMRLDPLSVYCIRKFGWFECGWSEEFISNCFRRAGLVPQLYTIDYPDVGPVCVAERLTARDWQRDALRDFVSGPGWQQDGAHHVSSGKADLDLPGGLDVEIELNNFRSRPIDLTILRDGVRLLHTTLATGPNKVVLSGHVGGRVTLQSDCWVPDHEFGNGDNRCLSVHLSAIRAAEQA